MDSHFSLKDAADFTGKSESTLKRLVREITGDPNHHDRSFILPSAKELEKRKSAGDQYVWRIAKEFLEKRYPNETNQEKGSQRSEKTTVSEEPQDAIAEVLQEQMRSKDRQIQTLEKQLDRKDEQIANQNERMRETNILMKELQLVIAAPTKPPEVVVQEPVKKASVKRPNTSEESTPNKARWWEREFHLFGKTRS